MLNVNKKPVLLHSSLYVLIYIYFQVGKVNTIVYTSGLNEYNLYGPCAGPPSGLQYNATLKTALFSYPHWRMSSSPVVHKHIQVTFIIIIIYKFFIFLFIECPVPGFMNVS